MKIYELLCKYLTDRNYNKDGSPSDDDSYYMIARIKSDRGADEIRKEIEEGEWAEECKDSEEITRLFETGSYVESSVRVIQMLSTVGHGG